MPQKNEYSEGLNLPYSLEAEQAVLGSILMDPESIHYVDDNLTAESFYLPEHQAIYRVMSGKAAANQPIDFVTVLEGLKNEGVVSPEEGKAYLMKLAQMVPSISNIANYARIVREKHDVRLLIQACSEIGEKAMDPTEDAEALLDSAEQKIFDIQRGRQQGTLVHIQQVIAQSFETFEHLTSKDKDQYVGVPTGYPALDAVTTGLTRSDLIVVGARPGMGKTSLALNVALNVALAGKTVAIFSLEMSNEQLVNRLLSIRANVSGKKMRTGNLTGDEWNQIAWASSELMKLNIYLDESSNVKVSDIKARLRRRGDVDFVLIDYLQLMKGSSKRDANRAQEVGEITRDLKIMAKELMVPVLVCAQLNRAADKQQNHRPGLADLRESGSVEQDADQVWFLYRDDYYRKDQEDAQQGGDDGICEVIVAKNRHGEIDTVKLAWIGEFTKFTNLEAFRRE